MKHLRISLPSPERQIDLSQFVGNRENRIGDWILHLNEPLESADAWVVLDDLPAPDETCRVPDGMLFFATGEVIQPDGYFTESPSRRRFLLQFDHVLSSHGILLDSAEMHPPFLPWMVNANHGPSVTGQHPRDLTYFDALTELPKPRSLSVFCSAKAVTAEQAFRLRFVQKAKAVFKDRLDWFGNGIKSVPEKWEGLAPYRYTIALENKTQPNVITEKVQDAFLTLSLPLYWGAPNLSDFFDSNGFLELDIRDWNASRRLIEYVIDDDPYHGHLPALLENKRRALDEMHYLKRLIRRVDAQAQSGAASTRKVASLAKAGGGAARYKRGIGRRLVAIGNELDR